MHDLDFFLSLPNCHARFSVFPFSLFGYVGLGPGPEFLPYFVALLSLVGAAFIAVLQWPVTAFLGYLSKLRRRGDAEHDSQPVESQPPETPHGADQRLALRAKSDRRTPPAIPPRRGRRRGRAG